MIGAAREFRRALYYFSLTNKTSIDPHFRELHNFHVKCCPAPFSLGNHRLPQMGVSLSELIDRLLPFFSRIWFSSNQAICMLISIQKPVVPQCGVECNRGSAGFLCEWTPHRFPAWTFFKLYFLISFKNML